ncbi:MAG: 30S ribosomal protein S20 [Candidatus Omnitrophica bacterium]|nr:30S ribosomal protein S20 [Candidatus Omnitrophota bacterium]
MPQRRSGIQELRLTQKKHTHNLDVKTELKKAIKKFTAAVAAKNFEEAKTLLKIVYKKIDKSAKRHILTANTAGRRKSLYGRMIVDLSATKK